LMAQGPSNRIHTRMLYKSLVYGALVDEAKKDEKSSKRK